jgi:hypothetical protein
MAAMSRRTVALRLIHISVALLLVVSCRAQPSADQLEWCAFNQAEVGRSAMELGIFDDPITFGEWKESNPDAYDRACMEAFGDASR